MMHTAGDRPLAMVYPEWQEFRELHALDAALCRGTLFKELDKPFCY
ncbi:MAG: spore coat associated protein CotJA [Ruminococcaceae bacterium]|nr:spore coat associated protein CotJA [Oscillospiraceae bacterium]